MKSSSLQWKHRSGPLAMYSSRSPSWVATSATTAPMTSATWWAAASSSAGRLGETPMIATTRSRPSDRTANASSTEESTPPENATPSRSIPAKQAATLSMAGSAVAAGARGDRIVIDSFLRSMVPVP